MLYAGFPSMEAFAEHYRVFGPRRPIHEQEHQRRFWEAFPHLVQRAQEERERARFNAQSYRDFYVGCALWAFKEDAEHVGERFRVFTGGSLKLEQDSRPMCAEASAIAAMRSARYSRIIGLVVTGEPQEDEESGLLSSTLHPCKECRRLFRATAEIRGGTHVITLTPDEEVVEKFTVNTLCTLHEEARQRHGP